MDKVNEIEEHPFNCMYCKKCFSYDEVNNIIVNSQKKHMLGIRGYYGTYELNKSELIQLERFKKKIDKHLYTNVCNVHTKQPTVFFGYNIWMFNPPLVNCDECNIKFEEKDKLWLEKFRKFTNGRTYPPQIVITSNDPYETFEESTKRYVGMTLRE
mmetsp:Transcript_43682/g.56019  ORF Transcript_43682/g.56019 Transcript_43682/m.56019 type:complete len:156 (-) Transcript_43682:246-713(-)